MRLLVKKPLYSALLLAVLAIGVASVASAQDTKELSAAQIMNNMQEFYKNTYDYQARFEQIYVDVAAGDSKKTGGRVYLKKPGKMRWDYLAKTKGETENTKTMVSNGKAFTIYEYEFNQYFRKCLKDSQLPTALSFLMGKGEMSKEFTPKLIKPVYEDTFAVEMTPKKTAGQYKKIVFIVLKENFSVKEAHVYDPYGNHNKLLFFVPLINSKLPDSGFDFVPPSDARRIGSKVTCK